MSSHNNRNLEPRYSRTPLQAKPGDQTIRPPYNPPAPQPLRNFIPQMADGQKGGDHRFQSDPQPPICVPNHTFAQPPIQQPIPNLHLQNQNAYKPHSRVPSNIRNMPRPVAHQAPYSFMVPIPSSTNFGPVMYPVVPNMVQQPIYRYADSNINSFSQELHFTPNPFQVHFSAVRPPQGIPQALNQYPQKLPPHSVPPTQVVPPPQPQKPRQRRGATIVDPATNQELNIDELASDKSKPTTASTSELPKENVATALPTTSSTASIVKPEEVVSTNSQSNVPSSNVSKDNPATDALTSKSTVESTSSTASSISQAKESKPSLLPSTSEIESAALTSKTTTPSETSSYSKSKPTITQSPAPTSSVSDSVLETPPTVKSQPEITSSKDLSYRSASAPIAEKATPINSSPPEAKTATSSPPFGRPSNAPITNSSPISSASQEPSVPETPKIEAQSAISQTFEDQTKTVGNDISLAVNNQQSISPKIDSTDRGQVFEENRQESEAAQLPPPKATKDVVSLDDQPDLLLSKPKESESLADVSEPIKRSASAESKPGKILYDANFLKQLRFNQLSVQKPNLPINLSIVRDHPVDARSTKKADCDVTSLFMPNYLQGQSSRSGRNSMQDGRMSMGHENKVPRKIISTSLSQDVKLRTVDNAWKPLSKKQTQADLDKTSELINRARSLLNKLTPDNYDRILSQIKELELDTKERHEKMLDLIFAKAIEEPAFCFQYAKVCKEITNLKPQDDPSTSFGKLLLNKCQKMFDTDIYADINVKGCEEEIKECADPEKKRQLIEELDEEKRIARKKSLGNIKLIGELFGLNLLRGRTMLDCINSLIFKEHEDFLECLCTLLRSIGQGLEKVLDASQQQIFNKHFDTLAQFAKSNKLSSRIRFMLMDLIELRENKWIPRKRQVGAQPKTIKEIHNDLRKQEQAQAQLAQRRSINERDYSKPAQRDFMSIVARKSTHQEASSLLKKMQGNPFSFNEFSLGDHSKFSKFSSGARAQNESSGASVSKGSSGPLSTNRYQGSSSSKDCWQRAGAGPSSSIEKTKQSADDDQFITFGNQKRSSPTLKKVDSEELTNKLKALLSDLNDSQNVAFRKSLPKLSRENKKVFADIALSQALDHFSDQPIVADIYSEIYVKVQTKDLPDFIEFIRERLEDSDLRIDYPKLDQYFGILLAKIFLDAPNDELRTVFTRMLSSSNSHSINIMKNVLDSAVKYSNEETIAQRWNAANLNWQDFSEDSDTVTKFQNDPRLDYLNAKKSISNQPKKQVNDITSKIIEETKGDFEPKVVAEKYKSLISEKDACEILSALLSYFIEKSYEEMAAIKDTSKAIEAFRIHFNKYCQLLCKLKQPDSVEVDKFLIKAVTEFNVQKERPKDLLFTALDILHYRYLIELSALEIWYEDKQGNQIDRAVVSKLIESIKSKTDSEN